MREYLSSAADVLREQGSDGQAGLASGVAAERLANNGPNKLREQAKTPLWIRFFQQMADPMVIMLIVAAVISAVTGAIQGEIDFADVIIIMTVVIINSALGVIQEAKSEEALAALQGMSAAQSKVMRDGKLVMLHSSELVVGDVVLLEAGDSVPADCRVLESASMKIEEAALTGESVPVEKHAEAIELAPGADDVPLGDRKNMCYMGSTVVYGRGRAVVVATGMDTEMGKIADALSNAEQGQTPLQIKLSQLSKILTWLVLGICVIIFAVQLLRAGGFSFEVILNSFMIAVSLAVAAIPEGLAAVVTVVLSIGVTNMSRRNAIIRRLTAVETLGCAQIICSDKTGTLTQNRMTVTDTWTDDPILLAKAMALCSDAKRGLGMHSAEGEPTEAALVNHAHDLRLYKDELDEKYPRIGEAPFDSGRKMMSTVHNENGRTVQYTKGATEMLLERCSGYWYEGKILPITEEYKENVRRHAKEFADRALRVLGAAFRPWDGVPADYEAETLEHDLVFIGFLGMIDPCRPEVYGAIRECREAGIRPIMITGDHIDTAVAIARDLGILTDDTRAITGSQLSEMSDEEFAKVFKEISVYARVQPEHKTRIVNAWRNAGYVTAMTGDGVNDAPSIKSADIGVGMGITGTDVTKNVADMVLADDNFATIVGAVEEGRRIYDNIRKAIQFLLGSNMSEVISIFVATLLGFTILEPVHLLWINLVTDCFPALALGMENAEKDIMQRRPRSAKAGIFAGGMGGDIAYQGLMVSVLVLASYFIGHFMESGVWEIPANGLSPDGTTMAFLTMSMAEIFHSLNMRSQRGSLFTMGSRNWALLVSSFAALLLTTLVCEVPFIAAAFDFTSVEFNEYIIAIGMGFLVIPIVEIVKFFQRLAAKKKVGQN